ncbi:putative beta-ureidopropionase [Helianthus annuus]|nr:putative beta-ureidopropionase [Helianthus annuus]
MEAIWLSFQEVSCLLIGLNCGKALEPLTVVETAKDLSSQHDLIFRTAYSACRGQYTAPFLDQKKAIFQKLKPIIDATGASGVNILCLQVSQNTINCC